jgi:uncharacterized DUF497 family protein
VDARQFQFDWDESKAATNLRKHGVSFDLACTVFRDPRILTVADLEHSRIEERWFSVGCAADGTILSVSHGSSLVLPRRESV